MASAPCSYRPVEIILLVIPVPGHSTDIDLTSQPQVFGAAGYLHPPQSVSLPFSPLPYLTASLDFMDRWVCLKILGFDLWS